MIDYQPQRNIMTTCSQSHWEWVLYQRHEHCLKRHRLRGRYVHWNYRLLRVYKSQLTCRRLRAESSVKL